MDVLESSISPRRADLLARLAAERSFLLQQLEGLDEATLTHDPVFGGWTAAGLLAHLAYWDALTADWLAKLADGRPGDIRAAGIVDGSLDARNADTQRHFAGLPFAQGVAMCQKERRGLLLALQRLPDTTLQQRLYLDTGHRATPAHWVRRRQRRVIKGQSDFQHGPPCSDVVRPHLGPGQGGPRRAALSVETLEILDRLLVGRLAAGGHLAQGDDTQPLVVAQMAEDLLERPVPFDRPRLPLVGRNKRGQGQELRPRQAE